MLQQIALGSALIFATAMAHGAATVVAIFVLLRVRRMNRTHTGRGLVVSALILVMAFVSVLDAVLWAYAYMEIGAIPDFESALYYSMVTFTTLGYGDITLGPDWRLLGGLEAANGIIMFGWSTAIIVAFVQRIVPQGPAQHLSERRRPSPESD
jgi:hypothetical protein